MRKPRALDLFCGAGGISAGYHLAGFEVTGVDIKPQPRYPFQFHQADALTFPLDGFDFIHASPPCQAHTSLKVMHNALRHLDLIPQTRERLIATGKPYVIENVPGAPLIAPILLCGTMFGLGCDRAELRRHRLFECSFPLLAPICQHGIDSVIGVYGGHRRNRKRLNGNNAGSVDFSQHEAEESMGIDWMNTSELSQAIPPAYSQWLGRRVLDAYAFHEWEERNEKRRTV
jgi:DNA (cytosine-5)-methyltransferase 1